MHTLKNQLINDMYIKPMSPSYKNDPNAWKYVIVRLFANKEEIQSDETFNRIMHCLQLYSTEKQEQLLATKVDRFSKYDKKDWYDILKQMSHIPEEQISQIERNSQFQYSKKMISNSHVELNCFEDLFKGHKNAFVLANLAALLTYHLPVEDTPNIRKGDGWVVFWPLLSRCETSLNEYKYKMQNNTTECKTGICTQILYSMVM